MVKVSMGLATVVGMDTHSGRIMQGKYSVSPQVVTFPLNPTEYLVLSMINKYTR
jgi:hypothetical protein